MKHLSPTAISLALAMLLAAAPLHAQTQRSGGGGETQKIMQQYQQIAAEKTALQAQVTQLKKDLDSANTELATVKQERDTAQRKAKAQVGVAPTVVAHAVSEKEAAERNLEQSKQRMTELVTKFREMAVNLKDVEADRTKVRKELDDRNTAYDKCAVDNMQLYAINGEVLDRLDHVGLFTRVSASEPFTRITRTRLDNLVVEYRERAQALQVKKPAP